MDAVRAAGDGRGRGPGLGADSRRPGLVGPTRGGEGTGGDRRRPDRVSSRSPGRPGDGVPGRPGRDGRLLAGELRGDCRPQRGGAAAFSRVPAGYEFASAGAYFEAEANLGCGRLSAAEARLEATLERGGPDLDRLVPLLIRVYQLQARFDDVRRVLRRQLGTADPPLKILRELDNLNRGRHAYDGLRAALERAGVDAPDDDRVWLGRGRLAIALGRWDEAADWLGRCLAARADAAVWQGPARLGDGRRPAR